MELGLFEITMIVFIPLTIFALNWWRKNTNIKGTPFNRGLYAIVLIALAAIPFIYLENITEEKQTILGVLLVIVATFLIINIGSRQIDLWNSNYKNEINNDDT